MEIQSLKVSATSLHHLYLLNDDATVESKDQLTIVYGVASSGVAKPVRRVAFS